MGQLTDSTPREIAVGPLLGWSHDGTERSLSGSDEWKRARVVARAGSVMLEALTDLLVAPIRLASLDSAAVPDSAPSASDSPVPLTSPLWGARPGQACRGPIRSFIPL